MTKKDLNQGAIIKTRNGDFHILVGDVLIDLDTGCFLSLKYYSNDLLYSTSGGYWYFDISGGDWYFDIVAVFNPRLIHSGYHTFIQDGKSGIVWTWEREEPKEMTKEEIEQELGYKIEIVQRMPF